MQVELLNINGVNRPHSVVSINKDGSCLFGSISHHIYGTAMFAQDVRDEIVSHVANNWEFFSVMTHDQCGNNYANGNEYVLDMCRPSTFGSLCELMAAGQVYPYTFEVYRNGELYVSNGVSGNTVKRLRFTGDLSEGHFDVYLPCDSELLTEADASTPRNIQRKRRARVTHSVRKKQLRVASAKYREKNPEVQKASIASYKKKHPEVVRKAVSTYQKSHPEVVRKAVSTYQKSHPEVVRKSVAIYQKKHPEVVREVIASYKKRHPEVIREAVNTYRDKNPEVVRRSTAMYQKNNAELCSTYQSQYRQRIRLIWETKQSSGLQYNCDINYESDSSLNIGHMRCECKHCKALKWKDESAGMCCNGGKIQLPAFEKLPEPLYSLIMGNHPEHKNFMDAIRKYNGCFQMTSFGAEHIVKDGFMPTFKVQGQVYHMVGSLLPIQEQAHFLQIYFVGDDERESHIRCSRFPGVKPWLVTQLQKMLHEVNAYVRDLKTTIERLPRGCTSFQVVIHAENKPANEHIGRFNAPTSSEVALVIVGQEFEKRDIVISSHDNNLRRISELNRSYDALQYPLMFCRGEDGYFITLPMKDPITKVPIIRKTVSAASYYSYRIMERSNEINHILYYRSLFSQYLVDMYAKIETERLNYIKNHQKELRSENYIHLRDAVGRQDINAENLGRITVLPSTFTGGPRYMHEKTQDAMTYVRHFGRPDLFITFTCNPKWPEIADALLPSQKPHDRHDIIARVFHIKVKKLIDLLTKGNLFGKTKCYMYSVEWQKRGLPHIHILIWLQERITSNMIDKIVSAEIPDPDKDPVLYEIVKNNMVHGPCGALNFKSPCMKEGKCSKRYPRRLLSETQTGEDGYPLYRRRCPEDGGFKIKLKDFEIDNRWIVPFNPVLLRSFGAHINVEICNSIKSIKYICKYINKGTDQAAIALENDIDEIKIYQSGRYISSSEAVWRILAFPIHQRYPPVFHLAVHLENGQRVYFTRDNLSTVISNPPQTTLLAFFELCKVDDFAKTLLYAEIPSYYVWNNNKFQRRKKGKCVEGWAGVKRDDVLGRVYTIHPNNVDCYHLRLLLHVVRGPTSFIELRTVNGVSHPNFQSACLALGLLEDDHHWDKTLEDAALSAHPFRIRELFAVLLVFFNMSDAFNLWNKYKEFLSEDIKRNLDRDTEGVVLQNQDKVYNQCLIIIEDSVLAIGGKDLIHYGLPQPVRSEINLRNTEYLNEVCYDVDELKNNVLSKEQLLTEDQELIYTKILKSIETGSGGIFFLDAPGGTGKTYLINLLLAKVRSNKNIALAVASSGIAATLLEGGKTAHSTFKLPLNLVHVESAVCNISKQSNLAEVLRECKLIVWDESTMAHKKGFEALDRTLQDIRNSKNVMGGVTMLLAGDFRQTLPIVPRGTRADEVISCLKSSYLWHLTFKLSLHKNMRVHLGCSNSGNEFSDILLQIGNGTYPEINGKINIPKELGIVVKSLGALISMVYPDIGNINEKSDQWLCERAILTPKNEKAAAINNSLLESFASVEVEYISIDSVVQGDDAVHYPVEFLNSLNPPGFPPHKLILKIGTPVMLLRNLKPPKLCNGTRLRVKSLMKNVIEASVLTGCAKGETVFIPRIPLIPTDYPFEFKRLQFPLKPSFAITINKSQGQSLKIVGVDVTEECFSHGQFYVACSRVSSPSNLYILSADGMTANIVYKEVLR